MIREDVLKNLYIEAVGLLIKAYHKLQQSEVSDIQLHLQAIQSFLKKNDMYSVMLGNSAGEMLKKLEYIPEPIVKPQVTITKTVTKQPAKPAFSYKSNPPITLTKPASKLEVNDDDLW